ncbi:MAG: SHOCT domain-containing protein [Clostridia bacterium]|nr:SHOCT domain-containing protein [Clostridia bacterium]
MDCYQVVYGNAFAYGLAMFFKWYILTTLIPLVVMAVLGGLIYLWLRSYELTITDKRIYGKIQFGKRVDLPVDSVSATATIQLLKGVSVSTSSGKISFLAIKNANEIYSIMNNLLIERQQNKEKSITRTEIRIDETEQLAKYKDLLDKGIITQEEFDAKKKQLLNL